MITEPGVRWTRYRLSASTSDKNDVTKTSNARSRTPLIVAA